MLPAFVVGWIDGAGEELDFALFDLGRLLALELLLTLESGETRGFALFGLLALAFFLRETLKSGLTFAFGGDAGGFTLGGDASGFTFGGGALGGQALAFGGQAAGFFFFFNATRFRGGLLGAKTGFFLGLASGFALGLELPEPFRFRLGGETLALRLRFALGFELSLCGDASLFFAFLLGLKAAVAEECAAGDDEENENGNDFTVHNGNDLL